MKNIKIKFFKKISNLILSLSLLVITSNITAAEKTSEKIITDEESIYKLLDSTIQLPSKLKTKLEYKILDQTNLPPILRNIIVSYLDKWIYTREQISIKENRCVIFSEDKKIAAFCDANNIWLVNVDNNFQKIAQIIPKKRNEFISTLALSPDNKYLACGYVEHYCPTCNNDPNIDIWNIQDIPCKLIATITDHKNSILDIKFSPNQKYMVSIDESNLLNIFETNSWKLIASRIDNNRCSSANISFGTRFDIVTAIEENSIITLKNRDRLLSKLPRYTRNKNTSSIEANCIKNLLLSPKQNFLIFCSKNNAYIVDISQNSFNLLSKTLSDNRPNFTFDKEQKYFVVTRTKSPNIEALIDNLSERKLMQQFEVPYCDTVQFIKNDQILLIFANTNILIYKNQAIEIEQADL